MLGGLIFGFYGIKPILYLSIVCFFLSAVMGALCAFGFHLEHILRIVYKRKSPDLSPGSCGEHSFLFNAFQKLGKVNDRSF